MRQGYPRKRRIRARGFIDVIAGAVRPAMTPPWLLALCETLAAGGEAKGRD
jgi:hypothetical protein